MVPFKMKYGSGGFPFKSALKQTDAACTEPAEGCPDGTIWDSAQCECIRDTELPSGPSFKSALKQGTQTSPCGDQTPCPDYHKFDEHCNCVPIKKKELIDELLKKGFTTTKLAEYDPSITKGTHKF